MAVISRDSSDVPQGTLDAHASINLSQPQLQAIQAPIDQPLLILAAAGSGKTLVLCHRVLHLILQGVDPKEILAVTFTRRAGQELRSRLQILANSLQDGHAKPLRSLRDVRVGTFHSFCLSIIRAFPMEAGLGSDFIIFTPKMQVELLQNLVLQWCTAKSMGRQGSLEVQYHSQDTVKCSPAQRAMARIEAQRLLARIRKLNRCNVDDMAERVGGTEEDDMFKWVHATYCLVLKEVNGVDFSSFIRHTMNVFECNPDALQAPDVRARHVLVDEFQDTDPGQFELLKLLCNRHQGITIVGDDDQQIYSWRGASGYQNFRSFQEVFSGATIVKLEQNFRSTGAIVAAARRLIARNRNRMPKSIRTLSATGPLLTICECRNELCEAAAVAEHLQALRRQGVPFRDMVVLYRLHRVGVELRHLLQARFIPCEMKGSSLAPTDGKHAVSGKGADSTGGVFDDVLAVLRLVAREGDESACSRLVGLFCGELNPAVSACLFHLTSAHRMSGLEAVKRTRSHILGLIACKELSSFEPAQVAKTLAASNQQMLTGLQAVARVVESAKDDVRSSSLRDVVLNAVRQVGPFRELPDNSEVGTQAFVTSRAKSNRLKACASGESKPSKGQPDHGFDYAGIKALLVEAASFETTYAQKLAAANDHNRNSNNRDRSSFRKPSMLVTLGSSDASSTGTRLPLNAAVKKVKAFLDAVALKTYEHELGELNTDEPRAVENSSEDSSALADVVTLSTIHQSKGLEWTSVIIVRANEGVLPIVDIEASRVKDAEHPHPQSESPKVRESSVSHSGTGPTEVARACLSPSEEELEEERRLFYVALTRARRHVLVTYVLMDGGQQQLPSRFLADVPHGLTKRASKFDSTNSTSLDGPDQPIDVLTPPTPASSKPQSPPPARKLKKAAEASRLNKRRKTKPATAGAAGSKFVLD